MTEPERGLRVRGLRCEAQDVLSLELEAADGSALPAWRPGAHIDLLLPEGRVRQYSLCGDPGVAGWRVAVLREVAGRGGSAFVHDRLRPGELLTARGPRNHFELVPAATHVFVAGGIGITPILPMLAAATAMGSDWRLLYGGRRRASMAFLDVLGRHGARVEVAPEDEVGRLDLDRLLAATPPDAEIYCCGPAPLLDAISERSAGGCSLHVERFAPVLDPALAAHGGAFQVVLQSSGQAITVHDGETILEALESAGHSPDCSCLEGTCGTCETRVIAGEVDHRDSVLTEDERRVSETMMICVSRSRSPRLVLGL